MVTISAVIFIAGAQTMVITAKIKELQYFGKFNEIFVLSMLILATNLIVKGLLTVLAKKKISVKKRKRNDNKGRGYSMKKKKSYQCY